MTKVDTIDLGTAASLDRQTLIDATARLLSIAATHNTTVMREILGQVDAQGNLAALSKALKAYPDEA